MIFLLVVHSDANDLVGLGHGGEEGDLRQGNAETAGGNSSVLEKKICSRMWNIAEIIEQALLNYVDNFLK